MTACPLSFVIRLPDHLSQATSLALDVPFLGRPYDPPVLGGEEDAARALSTGRVARERGPRVAAHGR